MSGMITGYNPQGRKEPDRMVVSPEQQEGRFKLQTDPGKQQCKVCQRCKFEEESLRVGDIRSSSMPQGCIVLLLV